MYGDSGSVLIAEAYAFGATDFNASGALYYMINGQSLIREDLSDYLSLGYVPINATPIIPAVSVTQEYANDDFAIAQLANALNDSSDYAQFIQRSGNWRNLFDNSSGYIQPRESNGKLAAKFSPSSESGFQEGDSAQYTWMETFDLAGLFSPSA